MVSLPDTVTLTWLISGTLAGGEWGAPFCSAGDATTIEDGARGTAGAGAASGLVLRLFLAAIHFG